MNFVYCAHGTYTAVSSISKISTNFTAEYFIINSNISGKKKSLSGLREGILKKKIDSVEILIKHKIVSS